MLCFRKICRNIRVYLIYVKYERKCLVTSGLQIPIEYEKFKCWIFLIKFHFLFDSFIFKDGIFKIHQIPQPTLKQNWVYRMSEIKKHNNRVFIGSNKTMFYIKILQKVLYDTFGCSNKFKKLFSNKNVLLTIL